MLVAMATWLSPSVGFTQTQARPTVAATPMLAPGDMVRITVFRNADLTGEFPIAADGSISHPLYREIKVTGVPMNVVEDRLRAFISKFETTPAFVVVPLIRIVVGGEVRTPAVQTVPIGTTISQAIALAGGPTDRANLEQVELTRQRATQLLDMRNPASDAAYSLVSSGDAIIVGRSHSVMREVIAPAATVAAALLGTVNIVLQLTRH